MGTIVTYQCDKCDYSAHISGGPDVGMIVKTNTFLCKACIDLVDIITEYWTDRKFDESDIGKCPMCSSTNLKKWNPKKRPCPKCNGVMNIPPDANILMWD